MLTAHPHLKFVELGSLTATADSGGYLFKNKAISHDTALVTRYQSVRRCYCEGVLGFEEIGVLAAIHERLTVTQVEVGRCGKARRELVR